MALFPAYGGVSKPNETDNTTSELTWLKNCSFVGPNPETVIAKIETESNQAGPSSIKRLYETDKDSSIEDASLDHSKKRRKDSTDHDKQSKLKKKKKKHKHHKKKHEVKRDKCRSESSEYFIDTKKDKLYFCVPYLSRPAIPRYVVSRGFTYLSKSNKKKNKRFRYFSSKRIDRIEATIDAESTVENKLTEKIKFFNVELDKHPQNVNLWLQYVEFQDEMFRFEKMYKNSANKRIFAEKKLLILDKALKNNPESEEILEKRFQIACGLYTTDKIIEEINSLLKTNKQNLILWKIYIDSLQFSMTGCTVSRILKLYSDFLSLLNQKRRTCKSSSQVQIENGMVKILHRCFIFLRQCGLWERLFLMIKMYLEMNISSTGQLKINYDCQINEEEITQIEERIIGTHLPSHELWYRIEKLREQYHWVPSDDPKCLDPQRMVFVDDVTDLVYPIVAPESAFKLVVIALNVLKIPLIPSTHAIMSELFIDDMPWYVDTIEQIFPGFLINNQCQNVELLNSLLGFMNGPKFLIPKGNTSSLQSSDKTQEDYLNLLTNVILSCAKNVEGKRRDALYVWWFKFQQMLLELNRVDVTSLQKNYKKKLKTSVKEMMKCPENRNNLQFYREYALLEMELSGLEAACKILVTAAGIQNDIIPNIADLEKRSSILSIYRTIIELLLHSKCNKTNDQVNLNRNQAINVLVSLAASNKINFIDTSVQERNILDASEIFKRNVDLFIQTTMPSPNLEDHFLPDYFVDFFVCYAWFLYLTNSNVEVVISYFDLVLKELLLKKDSYRSEKVYEAYVNILFKHCSDSKGEGIYPKFYEKLFEAIRLYPNNLTFLGLLINMQNPSNCVGQSWWKIRNLLLDNSKNGVMPKLFSIFVLGQQVNLIKQAHLAMLENQGGPIIECLGLSNKIASLFKKLTVDESIARRNGLIWRLYLKFLYHAMLDCQQKFYEACETLPWLKALYMDSALYIPSELPQIQDIMVEKELRVHLVPEELQILMS